MTAAKISQHTNFYSRQDVEAKTTVPPRQTTFAYYKISKLIEDNKNDTAKLTELNITKLIFVST